MEEMIYKLMDLTAWIGNVLKEIVKGVRGTALYWTHRAEELKQYE